MVLQALNRYYEILAADPESGIALPGYSVANVSFALNLSETGELLDIFTLVMPVQRGKKTLEVPQRMIVPEQIKRSGQNPRPNFLCDNSAFVLGLSEKEDAARRFATFRQWNIDRLAEAQCLEARAVTAFLNAYDPQTGKELPVIADHLDELLKGGNLVFKLDNSAGYVHESPEIRRCWEAHKTQAVNKWVGQCLVTGEKTPIARLHPSLKGINGANPTGATLVGFNAPAYESYNRAGGQGLNSPVSEKAAFAYTTVLNRLLSPENKNRKFTIGDATVVYWAESPDETYADFFEGLFQTGFQVPESEGVGRKKAELHLKAIAEKVSRGQMVDTTQVLEGLDKATPFYVLGLAPNAARVSVRFFQADAFVKIVGKITAHYLDLRIVKEFDDQPDLIPYWQILNETVSKKASDKTPSPLMAGEVFRAILTGAPYPAALYYSLINRVRADQDDSKKGIKKISYTRAAVIKAYLLRKYRHQNPNPYQEVLCMSLNEQATLPAYLLGRLFAVLEKAQKEAISNANATITDRYFTSACASPASVFPVLLRLSRHHIAKAAYGYTIDKQIEQIMNRLEVDKQPFPAHLSLDEQGIFILGYYHQRTSFYTPKNNVSVQPNA